MNGRPLLFSEPNVIFAVIEGCKIKMNFQPENNKEVIVRVKNMLTASYSQATLTV